MPLDEVAADPLDDAADGCLLVERRKYDTDRRTDLRVQQARQRPVPRMRAAALEPGLRGRVHVCDTCIRTPASTLTGRALIKRGRGTGPLKPRQPSPVDDRRQVPNPARGQPHAGKMSVRGALP